MDHAGGNSTAQMKASKRQTDTLGEDFTNLKHFCGSTGTKVMVTTGKPFSSGTKTEILDLLNGESCADLANFPLENHAGVGANLNGTPAVCGGYSSGNWNSHSQTCYKFKNGEFKEFASMNENRYYAAGIMYNNKLLVFGGHDGSKILQTSEIISIDGGVEYGIGLPAALWRHAITSFDPTVSILSGGSTSTTDYSPLTWFFDHETQAFSSGPSLLEGRVYHGSATLVDKVTQAKIPIVTGGYEDIYLSSTEMLINGTWQSGTIQCKKSNPLLICSFDICQT